MSDISANLASILHKIRATETLYHRPAHCVQLIAVSKTQSITRIQQAIAAGQHAFGENYVQEALPKITAIAKEKIHWHFIGAIQSNKTKAIAENFHWVHTIDSLQHAERLSAQRPNQLPDLNVCIQINIDDEPNKSGVKLSELTDLAVKISRLPHLKLRGLMAIPAQHSEFAQQREPFRQLCAALQALQTQGLNLDTLSMGMSDDFVAAIAEGATLLRIGTAIFGERS